jgi:hypothetical protein
MGNGKFHVLLRQLAIVQTSLHTTLPRGCATDLTFCPIDCRLGDNAPCPHCRIKRKNSLKIDIRGKNFEKQAVVLKILLEMPTNYADNCGN